MTKSKSTIHSTGAPVLPVAKPAGALARSGVEKGGGFVGQQRAMLSPEVAGIAARDRPLLRGLFAVGGGFFPRAVGHLRRRPEGAREAILIYCVKGAGWCDMAGRFQHVRAGDLLVVPPLTPHTYGAHPSTPWTIHWVHAVGENVALYLADLGVTPELPVLWMGEDLQLTALFNEVLRSLDRGSAYPNLLHASHTLGHLLALAVRHRHEGLAEMPSSVAKVGQSIVYMSEHLDQPLRVGELAALVNVSPAHFAVLFREATGSSPRDYLHLLRLHRACQLLRGSTLSLKEIAAQLGYEDPFYFSRQFKSLQGVSPSEYRNLPRSTGG